jgi:RNA polymerase subunit RPABC4/transcription elongation factor Spt4
MIIISQGAIEACPICGYSMSPDEWFDLEIEQYLEKKEPK